MNIVIPKETKPYEGRVCLTPAACGALVDAGHGIHIERGAGVASGFADDDYLARGAQVAASAAEAYQQGELVVKVKEPTAEDLQYLRAGHSLFCYLHLAALPELTQQLCDLDVTAVAFETVEDEQGRLPLLAPMSEIAGRISMQVAIHLLHQPMGGKGVLLGGVASARRGRVVVIGGGVAGINAAEVAAANGANVTVFDKKRSALNTARRLGNNVSAYYANRYDIEDAVREADIVIGAVLVTGARAPHVVDESTIRAMAPGSVVVDISVDQGGCIATTRATDYSAPTYDVNGVVHFCVNNMPGAVPQTASQSLSGALLPYVEEMVSQDWRQNARLKKGINIDHGKIVHPAVQASVV
ncbi:MAG: alanine dehydrogenase [Gammaproteobacteria bacterium]|nr:alanine dehydrogenase [Gammaproteobacteria bacterium]